MAHKHDPAFEISFYESVLRRDPVFVDVIELLGGLYTKIGRVADGLKMDRKLVRLQPSNATAHYNLACSLALCKRRAAALRSLEDAVALGYDDFDWMSQDPDLEGLKHNPVFQKLLAKLTSQSLETV
jgi:tetratricopeptide (TPR) repeat protein